jgi:hybrid cluster-associated redox disulfide protein
MITKDLTIGEVIRIKADAPQILMTFGMGCVGCPSSQAETIEDAAKVHGLNLEELLEALNK